MKEKYIKKILTVKSTQTAITNDVGGATYFEFKRPLKVRVIKTWGDYEVSQRFIGKLVNKKVIKTWGDYEVGQRFIGKLVNKKDIEEARKAGISGYTPEDYKEYMDVNPEPYATAVKAQKNFDPSIVFFTERAIIK